jgi:hypothetical protein
MRVVLLAVLLVLATAAPAMARPEIDVTCNGTECLSDWYRTTVRVDWSVAGGAPTGGCSDVTLTADTAGTEQGCIVRDAGGATASLTIPLKIDRTAPTVVAAAASRPPDHDGWYRAPVDVRFSGADALSGLASCTAGSYAGPDTAAARVTGTCTDVAGNHSAPFTFPLRYDATPPATSGIAAHPRDRAVRLSLPAGLSARIVRTPGVGGAAQSILVSEAGGTLIDRRVENGRSYSYAVTLTDPAGNRASRTLRVVPGPRLREPAARQHLAAPPLLRWTPVRGARYYNVQLKRNGKKILSRWPAAAKLQLPVTWRTAGKRYRLRPGRYRWVVWPGKGSRAEGRYGKKIGARSFVMVTPPPA